MLIGHTCSYSQIWTTECCWRSLKMKLMGGSSTLRPPPPALPPPRPVMIVDLKVNTKRLEGVKMKSFDIDELDVEGWKLSRVALDCVLRAGCRESAELGRRGCLPHNAKWRQNYCWAQAKLQPRVC
jgi:hypothetical protein